MKKTIKKMVICVVLPVFVAGALLLGIIFYLRYLQQREQVLLQQQNETQKQQEQLMNNLETKKEELADVQEQKGMLEKQIAVYEKGEQAADPAVYLKQKMLDCYIESQELLVAAQAEVLESLGVDTDFLISYDGGIDLEGKAIDTVQSAVITGLAGEMGDGAVSDVVGTTMEEAVNALREDMSADSLYEGITKGLQDGIANVMESAIQDKIKDIVGFDVFGAQNILEKLSGYEEKIPTYLASQISEEMQKDSDYLSYILTAENLKNEDLVQIQSYFYDLGTLSEELYNQTDGQVDVQLADWKSHDDTLREINERYSINEKIIEMCKEQLGENGNEE